MAAAWSSGSRSAFVPARVVPPDGWGPAAGSADSWVATTAAWSVARRAVSTVAPRVAGEPWVAGSGWVGRLWSRDEVMRSGERQAVVERSRYAASPLDGWAHSFAPGHWMVEPRAAERTQ